MLFDSLVLISLLVMITLLRSLVNIFPSLAACIVRVKESFNIDASIKLQRDRNILSLASGLPFCLIVFSFGLYSPEFMTGLGPEAALGLTIGIFLMYTMLRTLLRTVTRPRKAQATYATAATAAYTFFIILTLALFCTGGVMTIFNADSGSIKNAMIWVSSLIYIIFLIRKVQIFASSYNYFTVFLYLCALEIIPTGVLITSAIIF